MKIKALVTISIISIGLIAFSSCSKKVSGCTDSAAGNYTSSAEEDDGSCYYTGDVTFWTAQSDAFGAMEVTVAGQSKTITRDVVDVAGPSSCTSCSDCANFRLRAGSYTYTATDGQVTRNGDVVITRDSCFIKRIKR